MSDLRQELEKLVETSLAACQSWIKGDGRGGFRLIDPVDEKPIVSHYGDSHLATSLVILGRLRGDQALVEQGVQLGRTVIRDWASSQKFADFHHDFNNFALCLMCENLGDGADELSDDIQSLVLAARDSNHDTINWLPMRAYVNLCRYDWTNNKRYLANAERALIKVEQATNADGGIEDRLPAGSSYNLQYNVASLATMRLLSNCWPEHRYEQRRGLDFLLEHALPDGDINYAGRGANQIFAWGPWLYALAAFRETDALDRALRFLSDRYIITAKQHNIFLSNTQGREKLFWWDYHYCSVYHAHFLLWTTLALRALDTSQLGERPKLRGAGATGLRLLHVDRGGVAVFDGRKIYLAEAGPSVCALWLADKGMLFKGGLGPWQGAFGQKYNYADTVFQNHFGLMVQKGCRPRQADRLMRKLLPNLLRDHTASLTPAFAPISIEESGAALNLTWEAHSHEGYLNIPIFDHMADRISLEYSVDGNRLDGFFIGKIKSQYGWSAISRSRLARGNRWQVTIR